MTTSKFITTTILLASISAPVFGQVTITTAEPAEDKLGTTEWSMKIRIAKCSAYHIHINGKVDAVLNKTLKKIANSNGIREISYKEAVIRQVSYLNENEDRAVEELPRWRKECDLIDLYGQL